MKTTKIKILNIEAGAQFDNQVWDYWIIAELENGEIITIFDGECYIKEFKVGEYLEVFLSALFATTTINIDSRLFIITQIEDLGDIFVISNNYMSISLNKGDLTYYLSSDYIIMQIDSIRLKQVAM